MTSINFEWTNLIFSKEETLKDDLSSKIDENRPCIMVPSNLSFWSKLMKGKKRNVLAGQDESFSATWDPVGLYY